MEAGEPQAHQFSPPLQALLERLSILDKYDFWRLLERYAHLQQDTEAEGRREKLVDHFIQKLKDHPLSDDVRSHNSAFMQEAMGRYTVSAQRIGMDQSMYLAGRSVLMHEVFRLTMADHLAPIEDQLLNVWPLDPQPRTTPEQQQQEFLQRYGMIQGPIPTGGTNTAGPQVPINSAEAQEPKVTPLPTWLTSIDDERGG